MADTSTSPIDLGTLLINGNDAMLSNKSQSSTGDDPTAILTSLVAQLSSQGNNNKTSEGNTQQPNISSLPPAAIDAASKVQKKFYMQHAEDLVNSHPEGIAVLNQLLATHASNGGSDNSVPQENNPPPTPTNPQPNKNIQQSDQTQQAPVSIDDQIAQINKQAALNVAQRNLSASKPQGFMQRFSNNIAKMEGAVTQEDLLKNMGLIQKLAGAEPLQPQEIAGLNAGSYKAGLEASHQALATEATKLTALGDLYGKEQPNRNPLEVIQGKESKNQTIIRQNMENAAENITNHLKNIRTMIDNRPTFSSKGVNTKAQETSNIIKAGQSTTINGKTVRRIN